MNIDFQDRIDEYVLGRMSEDDKLQFESEVNQDEEKKEQLELTKNVRTAISSRQEKLESLAKMKDKYDKKQRAAALALKPIVTVASSPCLATPEPVEVKKSSHNNIWLWLSGIAAVLVVGFFVVNPFKYDAAPPEEIQRGDDDYMFCPEYDANPEDNCYNDTIAKDFKIEESEAHE